MGNLAYRVAELEKIVQRMQIEIANLSGSAPAPNESNIEMEAKLAALTKKNNDLNALINTYSADIKNLQQKNADLEDRMTIKITEIEEELEKKSNKRGTKK